MGASILKHIDEKSFVRPFSVRITDLIRTCATLALLSLAAPLASATATQAGNGALDLPLLAKSAAAEQSGATPKRPLRPLFRGASAVTSGFSGVRHRKPLLEPGTDKAPLPAVEYRFIDLDGTAVSIENIGKFGFAPNGNEISRPPYDRILARDTGQIFGLALDDGAQPNLYLAATSAYGLPIVGPDANGDQLPDRLRKGAPGARWMTGLFGPGRRAGPGAVWRVDGRSGQVTLFADILTDGQPNSGAGLGNIAYDAAHRQLFVSDLESGLIHRLGLDGRDLQVFDHGLNGRPREKLAPIADDKTRRIDITTPAFDSENPETWGYAPAKRRVWGLAAHGGRLYYAVADGPEGRPEVWSVGLDRRTGAILEDARWELTLPGDVAPLEISDIAFSRGGSLLLAQRGPRQGAFDFGGLAGADQAQVLRFLRKDPNDPALRRVASDWVWWRDGYDIGFAAQGREANGGLALGPGYDKRGALDWKACSGTLWSTGEALRDNADLAPALERGGALRVDGVQAQPLALGRAYNSPPWVSYFIDYDGQYPQPQQQPHPPTAQSGHLGDVEILGCRGGGAGARVHDFDIATLPASPAAGGALGGGLCPGGACVLLACLINPALCLPHPEKLCAKPETTLRCDTQTGTYVLDVKLNNQTAAPLDWLKLADPSGLIAALPQQSPLPDTASVPLTGLAPGQVGQINLCAYNGAAATGGAPYDCCNTQVNFKLPATACEKVSQ